MTRLKTVCCPAPLVSGTIAAKLGVDPNTAKGFILLPALEDDIAAAAEEAYCVDFNARDEIARIAEDLGVDADI